MPAMKCQVSPEVSGIRTGRAFVKGLTPNLRSEYACPGSNLLRP